MKPSSPRPANGLTLTYHVEAPPSFIESRAEALLLEQAVELPRSAIREQWVLENIVGEILSIKHLDHNWHEVIITHPLATTAIDPAQLLNVAFGNSSLQPHVSLQHIDLPEEAFGTFLGPKFGISGLRELLGVPHRALTSTALKPMGLSVERMVELCSVFASAGIDIIKDDHGLADHAFCPFEERVRSCLNAVKDANERTGRNSLYVPNLIGAPSTVRRQLDAALDAGAQAVMVSPMLIGLPFLHELAREHCPVPVIAHPAFGGALRVAPECLLGQMFRWYGADAIIYPHFGGRFSYSQNTCRRLADEMRSAHQDLRASFPVPAGGIKTSRIEEVLDFYGNDTILLIGGSLYEVQESLYEHTHAFVERVAQVCESSPASS